MATSRLLKLPPELRNIIFEFVVCSDPVMKVSSSGHIIQPPLVATNHQIRKEFSELFAVRIIDRADTVTAVVLNFDFEPLITALRTSAIGARAEIPQLSVSLRFLAPAGRDPSEGLDAWLKYNATAENLKLRNVSYEVDSSSEQCRMDAMMELLDNTGFAVWPNPSHVAVRRKVAYAHGCMAIAVNLRRNKR